MGCILPFLNIPFINFESRVSFQWITSANPLVTFVKLINAIFFDEIMNFVQLLSCILFVISIHQTTNVVFPNFFHHFFFSFSSWKWKQSLYCFKIVMDQWKVVFLFQLIKLRKVLPKIGENKIGCLVNWCHEQQCKIVLFYTKYCSRYI